MTSQPTVDKGITGWSIMDANAKLHSMAGITRKLNQGQTGNCQLQSTSDILFYYFKWYKLIGSKTIIFDNNPRFPWSNGDAQCSCCWNKIEDIMVIKNNKCYHFNCLLPLEIDSITPAHFASPFVQISKGQEPIHLSVLHSTSDTLIIQDIYGDGEIYVIQWSYRQIADRDTIDISFLLNLAPLPYSATISPKTIQETQRRYHSTMLLGAASNGTVAMSNSWGTNHSQFDTSYQNIIELYQFNIDVIKKLGDNTVSLLTPPLSFDFVSLNNLMNDWDASRKWYNLSIFKTKQHLLLRSMQSMRLFQYDNNCDFISFCLWCIYRETVWCSLDDEIIININKDESLKPGGGHNNGYYPGCYINADLQVINLYDNVRNGEMNKLKYKLSSFGVTNYQFIQFLMDEFFVKIGVFERVSRKATDALYVINYKNPNKIAEIQNFLKFLTKSVIRKPKVADDILYIAVTKHIQNMNIHIKQRESIHLLILSGYLREVTTKKKMGCIYSIHFKMVYISLL